jgi:hypothetical protein
VFTFHCPACKKQHAVTGPFPGPHKTQCFRCRTSFPLSPKNVQVSPDKEGMAPSSPRLLLPAQPSKSIAPPLPQPEPLPPPPKKTPNERVRRRRRWPLVASIVTAALLSLGGGAFLVFGNGKETPKKKTSLKPVAAKTSESEKAKDRMVAERPSPDVEPAPITRVENSVREPLEVVRKAIARKFGKNVIVTAVRLENRNLMLEGELTRWEDLRPAREVAVQALEEAGLGPIRGWDNHLKKPKK